MAKKYEFTGTTETGFEYVIQKANLNNYELVEALADLEEDMLLIVKVAKLILGEDQTKALKDHVRDKSGIVGLDEMNKELTEILQNKEVKK